jgi:branched-subunit amino acid aminotransferase/4-amino-4-deoxychorismate lyase
MPIAATKHIWFNGKLVPWEKATVHVLSHALHYGSSVFEGVRAYATPKGVVIFRLKDHTRRLFDSAKIYRIAIPFSPAVINAACCEVVTANGLTNGAYLRPVAFRGYGEIGVAPKIRRWTWRSPPGNGASISAPTAKLKAWMFVSRPGSAWRPTPCLRWPRLPATTCRAS